MVSVEPLPTGRYNILLHGVREFAIAGERGGHGYREATVHWRGGDPGGVPTGLRSRVHAVVQRYLDDREPGVVARVLADGSLSDELLVNFLCYALEFSPMEKQALLEADCLADRAGRLCDVVQFALEARRRGGEQDKWVH
jgi:hypothetical protein